MTKPITTVTQYDGNGRKRGALSAPGDYIKDCETHRAEAFRLRGIIAKAQAVYVGAKMVGCETADRMEEILEEAGEGK